MQLKKKKKKHPIPDVRPKHFRAHPRCVCGVWKRCSGLYIFIWDLGWWTVCSSNMTLIKTVGRCSPANPTLLCNVRCFWTSSWLVFKMICVILAERDKITSGILWHVATEISATTNSATAPGPAPLKQPNLLSHMSTQLAINSQDKLLTGLFNHPTHPRLRQNTPLTMWTGMH